MEKEFVPYEEALALKELGFDEPCMAFYEPNNREVKVVGVNQRFNDPSLLTITDFCAPLYQQAFRWFRGKGYHNGIVPIFDYHYYIIKDFNKDKEYNSEYEDVSYEEAELACLRKLIEIVRNCE
jgi:hypothetical protein